MLTSDLDADEEKDRAALDALLNALLKELDLSGKVGLKMLTPLNPSLVLMLTLMLMKRKTELPLMLY